VICFFGPPKLWPKSPPMITFEGYERVIYGCLQPTSGSRTSETGGGKFLPKFFMTLLAGAKSVANIDRGPKSLHFAKFTMLSFFLPPRGTKLHCQLRWGAMAGLAPWILHCCSLCPTSILIHNALFTAALYNIGLS